MGSETQFVEGWVRAFAPNVEDTRTVEFVISSSTRDRHKSVLSVDKWSLDNFNRNGIVGYQHNLYGDMCTPPSPDDVIGSGRAWKESGQLVGSVRFEPADLNPTAEKIFRKVLAGTLKATSVGFQPIPNEQGERGVFGEGEEAKGAPKETFYYHGQELLEFSIVNIPSNPDAIARSMRDQSARALLFLRKQTGLTLAEIEALTVRDLLRALDGDGFDSLKRKAEEVAEEKGEEELAVEVLAEVDPLAAFRLRQAQAELASYWRSIPVIAKPRNSAPSGQG